MIDIKRVEVLASEWGIGGFVGAPATRHEEREMAREILRLRRVLAEISCLTVEGVPPSSGGSEK